MGKADQRLGKRDRLRRRSEFLEVYRQGAKIGGPFFFLYLHGNGLGRSRLGITASRKVGKPVIRNRIKRHMREIFRACKNSTLTPACDLVVNVRPAAGGATHEMLERSFLGAIEKWRGGEQHQ